MAERVLLFGLGQTGRPIKKGRYWMAKETQSEQNDSQSLNILAIIPARGGSKALPGKNIRPLLGKPLINYSIDAALQSCYKPRVVVSTDSEEIAAVAREAGAEVPFVRPSELATDTAPTPPVIKHALQWLESNESYQPDIVVLLQPTSPLRRAQHIDKGIKTLLNTGADSVVSVCEAEHSPYWMRIIDEEGFLKHFVEGSEKYGRRQDLPTVYRINGALYITRPWVIMSGTLLAGDVRPFIMDCGDSVDIDDEIDFLLAELLLERRHGEQG